MINIEYQHFQGCPNSERALGNLKDAIDLFEGSVDYKETLVETEEEAHEVGFRGSPTVLINGEDFEGMPAPENPHLSCRIYTRIPTSGDILNKLNSIDK